MSKETYYSVKRDLLECQFSKMSCIYVLYSDDSDDEAAKKKDKNKDKDKKAKKKEKGSDAPLPKLLPRSLGGDKNIKVCVYYMYLYIYIYCKL